MPILKHTLRLTSGEQWQWQHHEGDAGAYSVESYHPGYLKLTAEGPASGERRIERIPWSQVERYIVDRIRNKPRKRK